MRAKNILSLLKKNGLKLPNKKELNQNENLKLFVESFPKTFYQALYKFLTHSKSKSEYDTGIAQYKWFHNFQFTAINNNLYFGGEPKMSPLLVTDSYIDVHLNAFIDSIEQELKPIGDFLENAL